jgi:hypothetical protein
MSKKVTPTRNRKNETRQYESDTLALQTLSLIAAPDPKDDLSDEELRAYFKKHKFTSSMIQQIIETVRAI